MRRKGTGFQKLREIVITAGNLSEIRDGETTEKKSVKRRIKNQV
jgi:hypothetical protein